MAGGERRVEGGEAEGRHERETDRKGRMMGEMKRSTEVEGIEKGGIQERSKEVKNGEDKRVPVEYTKHDRKRTAGLTTGRHI